jgi:hypothetical protein
MTTNNNQLTPEQIEHLSSLRYINSIDNHMKIVSSVKVHGNGVLLVLDIFIDDKQMDKMSFNLHNYDYDDIINLAQHIRENEYILRAVDTALAGDIE